MPRNKRTETNSAYYEEALRDYLSQKGLRCTQERVLLLRAATQCPTLFTLEDLQNQTERMGSFVVTCPTYYNALKLYQKAGLITSFRSRGQTVYQLTPTDMRIRCLTVCTRCNAVKAVKAKNVDEAVRHVSTRGFSVRTPIVYLYGLCLRCYQEELKQQQSSCKKEK